MADDSLFAKIKILYEDDNLMVIGKPAGLVVHADGRTAEPTVAHWFVKKYPAAARVGEPFILSDGRVINRPGIVHRIDRETSGALVLAKNAEAHAFLKRQFQTGEVKKNYTAFVYGEVKPPEGGDGGVINRPIARSRKDFRQWSAQRGAKGKEREAVTEYRVQARHGGFSLLDVSPRTGRTHQIRVHLKAINHPIVCDKLYAPSRDCALGFSRLALHAREISFTAPSGKRITVSAPYPEDFERAFKVFG